MRQAEQRRHLADELATTLRRIRSLDRFGSFGLPPSTQDLLAQAKNGPIVTFNISAHRGDALLLTDEGIQPVELSGLTRRTVIDKVAAFRVALYQAVDPDTSSQSRRDAQRTLREVLAWLWDAAAEPVLKALNYHHQPGPGQTWPHVWWVPGGLLGLLPLHAAGRQPPDTVLDRVVSSYTPTIGALRHARERAGAVEWSRAVVIAMTATPGLPNNGRLKHVREEVRQIQTYLPDALVLADNGIPDAHDVPTRSTVVAELVECGIAHFACHGVSDFSDPGSSRLLLHDHQEEPLTVASLATVKLPKAQLAYLSACNTTFAFPAGLLDEAIHLTSAFQLAGFPSVVGTLWEIDDACSADLAAAFYRNLCTAGTPRTEHVACALHAAVRELRDEFATSPSLWAGHIHAGA